MKKRNSKKTLRELKRGIKIECNASKSTKLSPTFTHEDVAKKKMRRRKRVTDKLFRPSSSCHGFIVGSKKTDLEILLCNLNVYKC